MAWHFTPVKGSLPVNKGCPEPAEEPEGEYPPKLAAIVNLFQALGEDEKRETLISYADQAKRCAPHEGEEFDLSDVRKDEECADTVGIFMKVSPGREVSFRMTLGEKVQILTRAMASILCKGLEGATLERIMEVPADFVPKIVGAQLVRVRSQTVYYILTRMKGACRAYLNREKAAAH